MRTSATFLALLLWTSISTAYECPSFAGREWEFIGHVVKSVSPGPPDYESVTSGDEPVTRWYLQLPAPACFAEHRYVTRFQLSETPQEVDRYRKFLGRQVRVKGALERGSPGRHTTSLVVRVSSFSEASP
jgi:hypothetical protein